MWVRDGLTIQDVTDLISALNPSILQMIPPECEIFRLASDKRVFQFRTNAKPFGHVFIGKDSAKWFETMPDFGIAPENVREAADRATTWLQIILNKRIHGN